MIAVVGFALLVVGLGLKPEVQAAPSGPPSAPLLALAPTAMPTPTVTPTPASGAQVAVVPALTPAPVVQVALAAPGLTPAPTQTPEPTPTGTLAPVAVAGFYTGVIRNITFGVDADLVLSLKQVGSTLTGEVEVFDPLEGDGPIKGSINGKDFEFTVKFQLSSTPYSITFTGSALSPGILAGYYSVDPTGEQGSWTVAMTMPTAALVATAAPVVQVATPTVAPTAAPVAMPEIVALPAQVQAALNEAGVTLGQPGVATTQPKFRGTAFVFGIEPKTWDTHRYQSYRLRMTNSYIHQRLLRFQQGPDQSPTSFTAVPSVAESWEVGDGGLKVVFNLSKGVKYHDIGPVNGREVVASDVTFTLDRIWREQGSYRQREMTKFIDDWSAPDDYTLVFDMEQPVGALLQFMAKTTMEILPPEVEAKCGDYVQPECSAIGAGPWMFTGYEPGTSTTHARHPDYWDASLPYIDNVVQLFFGNERSEDAAFRTGKVDILGIDTCGISGVRYKSLIKANPTFIYPSFINTLDRRGLHMKMDRPPFNDVRVRRAASMAIDREGWVRTVLDGVGIPFGGYLAVGNEYWIPDDEYGDSQKWITYDPDAARALLQQAGYGPDDINVTLEGTTGYGPRFDSEVELVSSLLNAVNINNKISMVDYDSFVPVWNRGEFENVAYTYLGFGTIPEDWLVLPFHSTQKGIKHYGLNDPELDAMLDGIQTTFDKSKRIEMAQAAARRIVDQAYFVNGAWWIYIYAQNPRLTNYAYHDSFDNAYAISQAWIEE